MFDVSIRFQAVAILVYIIIVIDYLRNKKLPVLSTKCFSVMLFFSGFNLVFDVVTVYTISNMDKISPWINRLAHQFFIGSLDIIVVSLFLYVEMLGNHQKRLTIYQIVLKFMPAFVALLFVCFGKLTYYNDGKIVYSYGSMATTIYVMVALYMTYVFIATFRYKKEISAKKRSSLRMGIIIWVAGALVQMLNPGLLLSSVSQTMLILFAYLAFENPKEYMDEQSGAFNALAFHIMLSERLAIKKNFCVISVVIEDLPRINANYGYSKGASLVKEITNALTKNFGDRIYHTRGNILSIMIQKHGDAIDEKTQKALLITKANLNNPFKVEGSDIAVRAHIDFLNGHKYAKTPDDIFGIVNYMAEHSDSSATDTGLYYCNEDVIKKMDRMITLESMIQTAIEHNGFQMFYQPIFDTETKTFHSAEALIRLKDSTTLGFVSPEEFIPIAEKKGMIMDVGYIVFEQVCRFAKENDLKSLGVDYIEVNLSGIQCENQELPVQLKNIMKKYEVHPSFINLEITETAMVENGDILIRNMNKLRGLGCSFSMDDFGTGYSNLSQMADLTYDLVKLDKSLIWPCFTNHNEKAVAILESVISMLLKMKVHIVAEGVETEEQMKCLTKLGVTYLQGYYFSKPVKGQDYIIFLKEKKEAGEENA